MTAAGEDLLAWLVRWYADQCDGDWEHQNGIHLETLDNPGWILRISLDETVLEGRDFTAIALDDGGEEGSLSHRWYQCRVEEGEFVGAASALDLATILTVFRAWAEAPPASRRRLKAFGEGALGGACRAPRSPPPLE